MEGVAPRSGRSPGRPRDELAGPAILAATRRLVGERGYAAVTTRLIAETAGVGKPTIYRRWPSKAELVLDAFLAYAEAEVDRPGRRGHRRGAPERVQARVAGFLRRTFAALGETGPAVRSLMATAQQDPVFCARFRTRFIEPRRQALTRLLAGAVAEGMLPADADLETAVIALYGAVWYRLLLDEPTNDAAADRLAAMVVRGLGGPEEQKPGGGPDRVAGTGGAEKPAGRPRRPTSRDR